MNKLRKLAIGALAATTLICGSFAIAACDKTTYADFINPDSNISDGSGSSSTTSAGYTIKIQSVGGLKLSGVQVAAKKNGTTLFEGISNSSGEIKFTLLDADEYDLEVDESTLPDGYYIPEGTTYSTTAEEKTVTISLSSRIITTTASGITYSLGDVMHDFSFSDTDGERHTLTELFETKKAVVLNFFYTTCSPCKSEFPAIQKAYANFSDDIDIIALSNQDSVKSITSFKSEFSDPSLTFYFGQDQASLHTFFSVSAWPTTVIIDRYGVIVYKDSGAITDERTWTSIFAKYVSDDYVQTDTSDSSSSDDEVERVKPTIAEPNYGTVASILNGEGTSGKVGEWGGATTENDKEYNWPWIISSDNSYTYGSCVTASNVGIGNSYAILAVDVSLKAGDILSFDYNFKTESGNDILYVVIDETLAKQYSGDSNGWQTENGIYIANREITINLSFTYLKDTMKDADNEVVSIGKISIVNAANANFTVDVETSAVSGTVGSDGKYTSYAQVELKDDGYYHVIKNVNGETYDAILLADILYATAWSSLHFYDVSSKKVTGASTFMAEGSTVNNPTALYWLTWWEMSNWQAVTNDEDGTVPYVFYYTNDYATNVKYGEFIVDEYYLQGFSDNEYLPVTAELHDAMVAFTQAYCEMYNLNYYPEQWLELCYYTSHYGAAHADGTCTKDVDPIAALEMRNAYTAYESTADKKVNNIVNVTKIMKDEYGGGLFFKFVPSASGVYYFNSNATNDSSLDPLLIILDADGNLLYEYDNSEDPSEILYADKNGNYDDNFYGYAYMTAGTTYYLKLRFSTAGDTGEYTFNITNTGETSLDYLRVCTTGDGAFSYDDNYVFYYLAVDSSLESDGIYYHVDENGNIGSKIYIDFVNPNFFRRYYNNRYELGYTLLSMIEGGDFDNINGIYYTAKMREYYNASIAGKDKDDELYGMVEANEELVNIISAYIYTVHADAKSSGYWKAFANYYQHFGA